MNKFEEAEIDIVNLLEYIEYDLSSSGSMEAG